MSRKVKSDPISDPKDNMFAPSAIYIERYKKCIRQQAELREELSVEGREEDAKFCAWRLRQFFRKVQQEGAQWTLP
jgi:hypothetical protein